MAGVLKLLRFKESVDLLPGQRKNKVRTFSNNSNYSAVNPDDITDEALKVWHDLPPQVRLDPSWAPFQEVYTRRRCSDVDTLHSADDLGENKINDVEVVDFGAKTHRKTSIDAFSGQKVIGKWFSLTRMVILVAVWLLFTVCMLISKEKHLHFKQTLVTHAGPAIFSIDPSPPRSRLGVHMIGPFLDDRQLLNVTDFVYVYLQVLYFVPGNSSSGGKTIVENISEAWRVPVAEAGALKSASDLKKKHVFTLNEDVQRKLHHEGVEIRVRMLSNIGSDIPVSFAYDLTPLDPTIGVIYAAVVLIGLYVMIIWEVVDRTFAAIIASTLAIGILSALGQKPSMEEIVSWIDVETILLLFGMMILVAIISDTGVFDFLAVYAYKITSGRIWPLINCLCIFTAVLSAFLDNVTTVLLMTPVTIRLCEVMGLNPIPVLIMNVIFSNIGGAMTPVGDPPNVIIASNSYISSNGVNFATFTMHMVAGVFMVSIVVYAQLRFKFRNIQSLRFEEPHQIRQMRREVSLWRRACSSVPTLSKDGALVHKTLTRRVNKMMAQLEYMILSGRLPKDTYRHTLEELQAKYPIKDRKLLVKSTIVLIFVIGFFFLHAVPEISGLSLGWIALLGSLLLMILSERNEMEHVLAKVEWSTLMFFAALFVLMEALGELGLIEWIGRQTENVILSVGEETRLAVAVLIILWVSALASAFVDNIPLSTMCVKLAVNLAENKELGLPLQPLVWALAFGACLGGNGTLIGASANVVCAGVAEQHGYKFTFNDFFKIGFPVMISSIIVSTAYLMLCHVAFAWH